MTNQSDAPSALRSAILALIAMLAGAGLWKSPVGPSLDFADLPGWWSTAGPPAASISVLRALGLGLSGATVIGALLGFAVAVTRSVHATRVWTALAPAGLRRLVALSVLAAGLHSTTAGAQVAEDPAVPLLIDLGPAGRSDELDPPDDPPDTPAIPPAETDDAGASPASPRDPDPDLTWTVQRGEHLWAIAEETLSDRGVDRDAAAVADYWRRLIESNRSVIGPDADLIHPGMVLTLPD